LKIEHLELLWDLLINKNIIVFDHNTVYKFMRNVCDAVLRAQVQIIDETELITFFSNKINSEQTNFLDLTIEGYYLFQTFFILRNKRMRKLILLGDDGSSQSSSRMTSYSNETGPKFK